jgi:two-component system response regulator NreC
MRDSLKYLLELKPWIKVVGQTDEVASALEMVNQHHPALMILDTNMPDNGVWMTILKQVKAESPQTRCLVLTDPVQRLRAARAAGADAVLMKGFAMAKLFAAIERLLSLEEDNNEQFK